MYHVYSSKLHHLRSYQFLHMDCTFDVLNNKDNYHRGVIRSQLTRNITATFDQVYDEVVGALRDCIPKSSEGTLLTPAEYVNVP